MSFVSAIRSIPAAGLAHQTHGQDVRARLTFIAPQQTKPAFYSQAFTGGEAKFGFAVEHHDVTIHDMRPRADGFTLDQHGFALRTRPTRAGDLYDDAAVHGTYYDEVRTLLREELGASDVVIFDATRRSDGATGPANPDGARNAATRIHVDYTANSGPSRARDVLGEAEVARVLASGGRILQVNVWRPIKGPVQRSPLALADAATVRPGELVATDQVFPDRIGEIYHLAHAPTQRWYYAPQMRRDELLLIKGWDSLEDGRAQFTPHSAFALPTQTEQTPPRESIEVRTFVVIA